MRLLVFFSKDDPNPVPMTNWPEDCLVKQYLLKAFSDEELERANHSEPPSSRPVSQKAEHATEPVE